MTDAPKPSDDRTTVAKIAGILDDAVDLLGLGMRVARDVRDLASNPQHGKRLREEAEARADRIRDSRKKEG